MVCPPGPAKAVSRAKRVSPFYPSSSPGQPLYRHATENTDGQTELVRKELGRYNLTLFINNKMFNMKELKRIESKIPRPTYVHTGALSKRRLHARMHVDSTLNIKIEFHRSELCMYGKLPRMLLQQ